MNKINNLILKSTSGSKIMKIWIRRSFFSAFFAFSRKNVKSIYLRGGKNPNN
jgi:hypothetical protein